MRAWVLLFVLAGCFTSSKADGQDNLGGGDDGGGFGSGSGSGGSPPPGSGAPCASADDCVLAAATCCSCPAFAVGVAFDPAPQCETVGCPMAPACPTSLVAACVDHACAAACAPAACEASCANGYALDAAGCLMCACAGPADAETGCAADPDCEEVPADCCGCAAGGADTAVLATTAEAFHAAMNCAPDAHCPPTNTCAPDVGPRCVQGACALVAAAPPAAACGRSDLPACPAAQQCIVNRDPDATMYGLGTCGMP